METIAKKFTMQKTDNPLYEKIGNVPYGFYVSVVRATEKPQTAVYMGLHQCYSSEAVTEPKNLSEEEAGEIAVKRLLEGGKGHFSPFESPSITFVLEGLNHGTLQQLLRSRIAVSPSVQSFRYTSQHIIEASEDKKDVESVIYLRPVGVYHDREAGEYDYTAALRAEDLSVARFMIKHVGRRLKQGMPPEQARGQLPFDYRQHAIITFNARSLMAFFDRRSKKDAQAEIRILSDLMLEKFSLWMPKVAGYYLRHRWERAFLAP